MNASRKPGESPLDPNDPRSPFRRGREDSSYTRMWIGLSLVFSCCIMGWVVSVPFRSASVAVGDPDPDKSDGAIQLEVSDRIQRDKTLAEQLRLDAIEMDRRFMMSVAEASYREEKPGIEHVRNHRLNYKRRLVQQIKELGQPKRDSLEWLHLQHLKSKLANHGDGPPEE